MQTSMERISSGRFGRLCTVVDYVKLWADWLEA
jgi:hypothetical protein